MVKSRRKMTVGMSFFVLFQINFFCWRDLWNEVHITTSENSFPHPHALNYMLNLFVIKFMVALNKKWKIRIIIY